MNWRPVKKLKPDRIHSTSADTGWIGKLDDPWGSAERYMVEGYLPPIVLCRAIIKSEPPKITRTRVWVLAGAIQSVKHLEMDTALLRKALRSLARA
jgi:hypothetical protein